MSEHSGAAQDTGPPTAAFRVCAVDAAALAELGTYGDVEQCARLQLRVGLRQGLRFLLDETGAPVREANRWLAALPTRGCHSPATWDAYARDFADWARWLKSRGVHFLAASEQDLADYHGERRMGPLDRRLSARSWDRLVSALDSFYGWARGDGLIASLPFVYKEVRLSGLLARPGVVRSNMAREPIGRRHATLKWLEREYLAFFLDVGLSGLLPDGRDDPSFLGRNAARNRAAGSLMATAGLRQSELSLTLTFELPSLPGRPVKFVEWSLPDSICKNGRGRKVLVPRATLSEVHSYINLERALVAEEKKWRPARPLLVTEPERDRGRVDGQVRRWDTLGPVERLRLVLPDGSSPLLALQSTRDAGAPLLRWNSVFNEASRRCRRRNPDFPHVTPHTMRHSFAVHMLSWLQNQAAREVSRRVSEPGFETQAGYWRSHDPLLTLRDLLGYGSATTTEVYLQAIDAVRQYATLLDDEDHDDIAA